MQAIQFIKAIQRLPDSAITINGGYVTHYLNHPNQLVMNALIILSGVATGLLNVPSLMALQTLDHDCADVAIDAQLPGMVIMGCCSAVAQVNFLLSDLVKNDGAVYADDYRHLMMLQSIHKAFLDQFDLTNLNVDAFNDEKVDTALKHHMRQWLSTAIIEKINQKRKNPADKVPPIEWPALSFVRWINTINPNVNKDDTQVYMKLDQALKSFKETYGGILNSINQTLIYDLDAAAIDESFYDAISSAKDRIYGFECSYENLEDSSTCWVDDPHLDQFFTRLSEALNHTADGDYLFAPEHGSTNKNTIQVSKNLGIAISYINIFVNVLIGLGAFFALGQFIFWIAGTHLAIFMLGGVLGWVIKLAFAGLCAIGAYFYTRHDIQSIFNQMGYQLVLWFKDPNRWQTLWNNIKKPQMLFTILATLPAAIGISMINALGFYLAMPASPIIFALALVVFISTFIAIIALMGKRMYNAYPRFNYYWNEYKQKMGMLTMNALFSAAVVASVFTTSAHVPILLAFWSVTPFSTLLLAAFIGMIVFSSVMAISGAWRLKTAFSVAVGMICVLASMVTVFVALTPIVGAVGAALVGLTSSVLFFSFFVSSIMVNETNEKAYVLERFYNQQNMSGFMPGKGINSNDSDTDNTKIHELENSMTTFSVK